MRCQHCDYLLFNLTRPVCPECGRAFNIEDYGFRPGDVSFNCPHCDQAYNGNDAQGLPWPRQFECVSCQRSISLRNMRVVPRHADAMGLFGGLRQSPWDRRHELGWLRAWWETLTMTLVRPASFFREHTGTSIKEAWIFSMISLYVGLLPSFLFQIVMFWGMGILISGAGPSGASPAPPLAWVAIMYLAMGLTFPLFIQFLSGGLMACTIQLGLWLLAPQRKPMDCTFRTVLYSFGPIALCAVPFCGGYVSGIWQLVTLIIGIKEVHGIGGWRASIVVLWPLVVLFVLYLAIIAAVIVTVATG